MHPLRIAALLLTLATAPVAAQQCRDSLPPTGHLGFRWLHCPNGGPCWISNGPDRWYDLSNVPRVRMVDPAGPAAGILRDGDMLVAIDGMLTTSLAGGKHLGNLLPDRPVELTVQRAGHEHRVTIVPRAQCGMMGLAVNSVADSGEFADLVSGRTPPRLRAPRVASPDTTPVRRTTSHLQLEFRGAVPRVEIDSISGTVRLTYPTGRVTIIPRSTP